MQTRSNLDRIPLMERVKTLREKRMQLGWSLKKLAEEANVPYSAAMRIEKGIGFWDDWFSLLDKTLNKALYNKLNKGLYNKDEPGWSRRYEKCVNCGTNQTKHRAKGLCIHCYQIRNEEKQKDHVRKRGMASTKLTKEYLLEEYVSKKKSLGEIARESRCTRQYVHNKMKSYQIPLRNKSSARVVAVKKGKISYEIVKDDGLTHTITHQRIAVNEDFFSSWSQEMAWVLGIIYTDGCLWDKDQRIRIDQKDPELLEKVKALMSCNAELYYQPRRRYGKVISGELYSLQLYNPHIYSDLLEIGLKPDKSLDIEFPTVPPEFIRHFIRGCWDGDGTVYIEKRGGLIRAGFYSGSLKFIKAMLSELEKAGLKKRTIHTTRMKSPSYYFRFASSQCEKLYHYLYDDVPPEQYLQRKHDLFEKYFEDNYWQLPSALRRLRKSPPEWL